MSNFWGAVQNLFPILFAKNRCRLIGPYTGYISAALSYNAVPAVYKAMTADKESFHQE